MDLPSIHKQKNYSQTNSPQKIRDSAVRVSEEDDAFEFNDLDTDERVNSDILQFDINFPDPSDYCIGFIV